jgi:hypothetical protein
MALGRKTGGRTAGTPNKATADIKAAAKLHGPAALQALADIAMGEEHPPAARVSAAIALLDRGFGKPSQSVELTGAEGGPVESVTMTAAEFHRIAKDVAAEV